MLVVVTMSGMVAFMIIRGFTIVRAGQTGEQELAMALVATKIDRIERPEIPSEAWSAFQRNDRAARPGNSHDRFRLAGTFFVMGSGTDNGGREGRRMAIIDDVETRKQHIVNEGQSFEDYDILRIYQDRLIMRRDGIEVEINLSFKGGVTTRSTEAMAASPESPEEESQFPVEENKFGRRIGETRWVIQKDALVDYYHELLDEPERIAAIYMSMKPDYQDGEVAGYHLQKEGEHEFFDAMGLREGDRIRSVNSMRMISQARAEYFISEFMQDRLGAVVLDIERDGEMEKLIYLLR